MPASIRNVSTRGMMLRMPQPPRPGTYVEIETGASAIAARAVWTAGQSCGLHSRERFDLASVGKSRGKPTLKTALRPQARQVQRRLTMEEMASNNRLTSNFFQYLTFAAVGIAAASSLGWEVYHVLSAPMATIHHTLGQK